MSAPKKYNKEVDLTNSNHQDYCCDSIHKKLIKFRDLMGFDFK